MVQELKNLDYNLLDDIKELAGKDANPRELPSLTLAYMGDCVFEMLVRTYVIYEGGRHVKGLNIISDKIVNAKAQSDMYHNISDMLTEEEIGVFRRGRNAKSASVSKSSTLADYRRATGLEALFGYLYLKGDIKRAAELFKAGLKSLNGEQAL